MHILALFSLKFNNISYCIEKSPNRKKTLPHFVQFFKEMEFYGNHLSIADRILQRNGYSIIPSRAPTPDMVKTGKSFTKY